MRQDSHFSRPLTHHSGAPPAPREIRAVCPLLGVSPPRCFPSSVFSHNTQTPAAPAPFTPPTPSLSFFAPPPPPCLINKKSILARSSSPNYDGERRPRCVAEYSFVNPCEFAWPPWLCAAAAVPRPPLSCPARARGIHRGAVIAQTPAAGQQ